MTCEWTIVDTETTGFASPIYTLEIGAQRMRDWQPVGEPFRILLDHDVSIPPGAEAVHGYSRAFLAKHGSAPASAHRQFADYAADTPLVAYNLPYDYDKVLVPEWQRLQVSPQVRRGFCALSLAQKLIVPKRAANFRLQTLREFYGLPDRGAHNALGDVQTVIDLLIRVMKPLAEHRGIDSYAALEQFARDECYPEQLAFGKYKGRSFHEAREDRALYGWIEWLSRRDNDDSARIGRWYLEQLKD